MHRIKSPIFIFSLPRSGSTLLQRIIMGHSQIASVAEPWIMLPLIYGTRKSGMFTEYNQDWSSQAVTEFISGLPGGTESYQADLRNFVMQLYSKHCLNDEQYFLDKTPRYYLIINELAEIFPEAKFIFLFRNPVEILNSIFDTWGNRSLRLLHAYTTDLFLGPKLLTEGYSKFAKRSHRIDYQTLLEDPIGQIESLCSFLNLNFEKEMIENFPKTNPKGTMGDDRGIVEYDHLSTKTFTKWMQMAETFVHKQYLKHYINSLEQEVILGFGFQKNQLIKQIQSVKIKRLGNFIEWYFWARGIISIRFKLNLLGIRKKQKAYYS